MAHLFNKSDYNDYHSRFYSNIKKTLESKVEQLTDAMPPLTPQQAYSQPEEVIMDEHSLNLTYQGQTITLPRSLLELDDLSRIVNMSVIKENFSQEEMAGLKQYLPQGNLESLQHAIEGKNMYETHLSDFTRKLKTGYFTWSREREEQLQKQMSDMRMKTIYQDLLKKILKQRSGQIRRERFVIEDENSEVQSLSDLSQVDEMSENSQATETEEEIDDFMDEEYNPKIYFRYDYNKIKTQEELLALGEEKITKKEAMYKITLPARPKDSVWVDNYRRQEYQRYSNPTKPWVYTCEDGRKVTVAPVAKKISVVSGKPRDHPLLKLQRPACVTILTIVRDAAARLPNGVGTRADISQLLKESQYVNEDLPEEKLSNIVSGALDRLHYMTDACVKYDSEKKLWIYLHGDRNYDHPGWGEDGQDYQQKFPSKKRRRQFE